MNEKILRSSLAIIQSFLVILLTYLLSAVRETEIVSTTAIALCILHYFVFYISDYGQDFFKRRYLIELVQTLKYILLFA
ncbi:sugar transferase, partial [Streptococcus pneumoniae]